MSLAQIPDDWQKWIEENISSGCTPESLIEVMLEKNFSLEIAKKAVSSCVVSQKETPRFPQKGNVIHTCDREVHIVARITKPIIAVLDGLLDQEECKQLIQRSQHKLNPSTVVDPKTGHLTRISERTSQGTFFELNEDDFIAGLDRRISDVMNWPIDHGEGLQILNYQVGGEYRAHFDYFPEDDEGSKPHLAKGGQRVSTLVIYLNDVEAGGETIFPEIGFSVTPKQGSAVYFEYCNRLGQVDPLTLHAGAPVSKGEKWIATKWMRQQKFI